MIESMDSFEGPPLPEVEVAIAFTIAAPSDSPNVRNTSLEGAAAVYLNAIEVAFASVRRFNPGLGLRLFISGDLPNCWVQRYQALGCSVEPLAFTYRTSGPQKFKASLYMLDAVSAIRGPTLFIDPDVICVGNLGQLIASVRGGSAVLDLKTDRTKVVNGLSLEQADRIHQALGSCARARHFGGEFVYIEPAQVADVVQRVNRAWAYCMTHPRPAFLTEEHYLSFALSESDPIDASPFVSRIWTAHRHRRVEGIGKSTVLWHLPAEKERGFVTLSRGCCDRDSWFWRADDDMFKKIAGKELGIWRRRWKRRLLDAAGMAVNKISTILDAFRGK